MRVHVHEARRECPASSDDFPLAALARTDERDAPPLDVHVRDAARSSRTVDHQRLANTELECHGQSFRAARTARIPSPRT